MNSRAIVHCRVNVLLTLNRLHLQLFRASIGFRWKRPPCKTMENGNIRHDLKFHKCLLIVMKSKNVKEGVAIMHATHFPSLFLVPEACNLMFSSLAGLGMKPISAPSFTNLPIHQSLLYFCRMKIKSNMFITQPSLR